MTRTGPAPKVTRLMYGPNLTSCLNTVNAAQSGGDSDTLAPVRVRAREPPLGDQDTTGDHQVQPGVARLETRSEGLLLPRRAAPALLPLLH